MIDHVDDKSGSSENAESFQRSVAEMNQAFPSHVMGVDISSLIHCWVLWISADLKWKWQQSFFFLLSLEIPKLYEDRLHVDLFCCGELGLRLGTGIRSTQKPQHHVSPTDTHTAWVFLPL